MHPHIQIAPLTATLALAATASAPGHAVAGEVCTKFGLPGAMLGSAQPLGPLLGIRAGCATIGTR